MASLQITIIGAGKVAWSLIPALQAARMQVQQLISRNPLQLARFGKAYALPHLDQRLDQLHPESELVILTVPDSVVPKVAAALAPHLPEGAIVVHTSGSVPLSALEPCSAHIGVFYPMQTFTLDAVKPYSGVPLFLEGNEHVLSVIQPLAEALADKVQILDSASRAKLHLGAVMVCNFTNLLYTYADELIPGVNIQAYEPLIRGHLENVFSLGPRASMTGPAARGDEGVIQSHLEMLLDKPEVRELYERMSRLIQELNS